MVLHISYIEQNLESVLLYINSCYYLLLSSMCSIAKSSSVSVLTLGERSPTQTLEVRRIAKAMARRDVRNLILFFSIVRLTSSRCGSLYSKNTVEGNLY